MSNTASLHVFDTPFHLPEAGARATFTTRDGVLDALAIASLADEARQNKRLMVVVCADPGDCLRLYDELTWLAPHLRLSLFPDWETLPYDTMSPHEDLVSERLQTLWRLSMHRTASASQQSVDLLIASATTAAQRIAPATYILGNTFFFKKGQNIHLEEIKSTLVLCGYNHVDQVMAAGEFCARGGILDVFPMGSREPFRLDLFDDEIEEIRRFDPQTQRSTDRTDTIRILPAHEFPMDETSRNAFRSRWRSTFSMDPNKSPVYTAIGQGVASAGIEYYLSLFYEHTQTLVDYLPADSVFITLGQVEASITRFLKETSDRYRFLAGDSVRPALPPDQLIDTSEKFFSSIAPFGRIHLVCPPGTQLPCLTLDRKAADPAGRLKTFLRLAKTQHRRVLIGTGSPGRTARLEELLDDGEFTPRPVAGFAAFVDGNEAVGLCTSPLSRGFELTDPSLAVLTEKELYEIQASPRRTRIRESHTSIEAMIRDISELKLDDPVVHIEHGIGRYRGLETIQTGEGDAEFVRIDYAKDAKLFVPVTQLHLISRYTGADAEHAPMHALGRGDWEKAKKKAAQKVRDTAAELLHLYALRQAQSGFAFSRHDRDYEAFCEGFEFEETPDQAAAIAAVIEDMRQPRPMDRLVCGDVGFGKTEVALRAAFLAVMNGRQVAVLCPTTLLAEQHAQTFRDRFSAWPVKCAELSRFRTGRETTQAIRDIEQGTVDIVIGTHKLLSENVKFARLGLVVIDEEHRFGVRQKEKLKALRAQVDVLTLTATPIPRTLAMSLEGIRDFSIIATAPQKRLSIKTFVRRESNDLIREAVVRELKRGGQVYFLHNEVETINNRCERLQELIPEARIGIAHGQMSEHELERVMRDFYQQRYNVLLCSTIIETGIDVPNANTILMHRADKFGLAQLHQLRGRVGRSHHQAYAYLLTPEEGAMTKNALKRLDAIQNLEDLGSGFYLSMHDLEIRGAGEVLGDEQSGEMAEVGFDLYTQMLKSAVDQLKRGETLDPTSVFSSTTEINLHFPALLPSDYIADVASRLGLYKRLAATEDLVELEHEIDHLIDRFGPLPEQTKALIATHRLRLVSKKLGIRRIDAADSAILFTFGPKTHFDPLLMITLLQTRRDMRMMGPDKVRLTISTHDLDSRVRAIRTLTNALDPRKE